MLFDTVASLLKEKERSKLVSIAPTATVAEAVRTMNAENIGSVVVLDQQQLVGIFTERDVLARVVGHDRDPQATPVSEVMTAAVRCVELTTTVDEALQIMSSQRHRHLPVLEGGRVHAMVSIGDVTRWVIHSQQEQVNLSISAVKRMGMASRRG